MAKEAIRIWRWEAEENLEIFPFAVVLERLRCSTWKRQQPAVVAVVSQSD